MKVCLEMEMLMVLEFATYKNIIARAQCSQSEVELHQFWWEDSQSYGSLLGGCKSWGGIVSK